MIILYNIINRNLMYLCLTLLPQHVRVKDSFPAKNKFRIFIVMCSINLNI